jgi:hypothetical protein
MLPVYAVLLAVVTVGAWTAPARGQALGIYDAFSSGQLDPRRWRGYEGAIGGTESRAAHYNGGYHDAPAGDTALHGPNSVAESRRRVINGQAQVALTASRRISGFGGGYSEGKARAGLRMTHPGLATPSSPLVTTLRASVTVAALTAEPPDVGGCSAYSKARAQVFGHFFNDGSSTGPGDLTGDIFALVSLERASEETSAGRVVRNFVQARMGRCGTAGCRIHSVGVEFTRGWTVGVPHVLTITWQPAKNRFAFTVSGGGVPAETRTLAHTSADAAPPRGYAYDLRVESQPGFCGIEGEGFIWETASIDARFDNVQLNSAAATAAR